MGCNILFDVLIEFFKIFAVFPGEYDVFYFGAVSGDDFLFNAADRHDLAAQGEFAGHGYVRDNGLINH